MKKDKFELYGLAAIGLAGGVFKYYVRPELTAKRAWAAIGAGVLAYEIACPDGELLSEGIDRAIEKRPVAVSVGIGITALHLANAFDYCGLSKCDPFTLGIKLLKG